MAIAGTLKFIIGADTRGLLTGVSRSTRALSSLLRPIGAVRMAVFSLKGAFAALGLAVLAKSFLNTASAMEKLQMSLQKLTLGRGKEVFLALNKWARDMPVDTQKAIDVFRLLRAYHLRPTLKDMTVIVDAVSALGGSKDILEGIARALGQISAKGRPMQQEMNQLAERGIPSLQILQEKLGLASHQVAEIGRQGLKSGAVLSALMEGMEEWAGGLSKLYMSTWFGLMERLKSWATEFKRVVMNAGPFRLLKDQIEKFLRYLESQSGQAMLSRFAKNLTEGILKSIKAAVNFAFDVVTGFTALLKVVMRVKSEVMALWEYFKVLVQAIKILNDITGATLSLGNAFDADLEAVKALFQGMTLEGVKNKVIKIFDWFAELGRKAHLSVTMKMVEGQREVVDSLNNNLDHWKDYFSRVNKERWKDFSEEERYYLLMYEIAKKKITETEKLEKLEKHLYSIPTKSMSLLDIVAEEGGKAAFEDAKKKIAEVREQYNKNIEKIDEWKNKFEELDEASNKYLQKYISEVEKLKGLKFFPEGFLEDMGIAGEEWSRSAQEARVIYENFIKDWDALEKNKYDKSAERVKKDLEIFIRAYDARKKYLMTPKEAGGAHAWILKSDVDIEGMTKDVFNKYYREISKFKEKLKSQENIKDFENTINQLVIQPWYKEGMKVIGIPSKIVDQQYEEYLTQIREWQDNIRGAKSLEEKEEWIKSIFGAPGELGELMNKYFRISGGPLLDEGLVDALLGTENAEARLKSLDLLRSYYSQSNDIVRDFVDRKKYLGLTEIETEKKKLEEGVELLRKAEYNKEEIATFYSERMREIYSEEFDYMRNIAESAYDFFSDTISEFAAEGKLDFESLAKSFAAMILRMVLEWNKIKFMRGFNESIQSGGGSFFGALGSGISSLFGIGGSIASTSASAASVGSFESLMQNTSNMISGLGGYNRYASGGWINEPVIGVGVNSGQGYSFAENGPELVSTKDQVSKGATNLNVNNYINAIDAPSMESLFRRNPSVITNRIIEAITSGDTGVIGSIRAANRRS